VGSVRVADLERVRTVTFDRPEALNAFNHQMYEEVRSALQEAQQRRDVAVVVLTGAGRAFCAGQDLAEMAEAGDREPAGPSGANRMPHGFAAFMDTLIGFEKPLVAAVNGVGVGLGVTMLGHCDLVLMADNARLRAPFASLGVAPEAGSSVLLVSMMGWQRAAWFFLSSEWMGAQEALQCGLAWRVCPAERLMEEASEVARAIARMPVASLTATKRLMLAARQEAVRAAREREDREFSRLVGGPANREALAAFAEKRQPDFTRID